MYGLMPYRPARRAISYNPFKEFDELEKRFFGVPFGTVLQETELAEFKTDISDQGDFYLLEADLPGFKKEDISLDLDGDKLTIQATRHSEHEEKDKQGNYVCCERSYGTYTRSFDVAAVDTDNITAKLEEGVLKLTLPKKQPETPTARKLEIE